jgi:hypothetical protein
MCTNIHPYSKKGNIFSSFYYNLYNPLPIIGEEMNIFTPANAMFALMKADVQFHSFQIDLQCYTHHNHILI